MSKKDKTTPDFFYLPPKEEETMKVLWSTKDMAGILYTRHITQP